MADEPTTAATDASDAGPAVAGRVRRRRRTGRVVGDLCDKTITVAADYMTKHGKYGKFIRRRTKVHVHDAENQAKVGDVVEITECRPVSKTKSWRLVRVVGRS